MKLAGSPLPHESADGHVTGAALYTDDLVRRFPAALHAWPVMAPHAHAEVLELDASPALRHPGVVAALTGSDVPGEGNSGANRHDEPLFPEEVLYYGQPVAWVLGETLEAARQGASSVTVRYEPLPAILGIEEAIAQKSFLSGPARMHRGDAAAAIAEAPCRVRGELRIGGQEHFYLETQCALACLDESGGVFLHCSTQHPTETQAIVARALGIGQHRVTVECLRMGGAFGGKEVQANAWAAIAALGAWKTRRPVRVRLPRALDMALTGKRHPFLARYTAGYDTCGILHGFEVEMYSDGGWSLDLSEPVLWRAIFHLDNAYLLPAVNVTGYVCRTHKTSQTAFRGFGGPQGMLVIEDALDRIARTLGLPPETVRERNFYREGDTTHYGMPVKDAGRIARIWGELKESASFDARREAVTAVQSRAISPQARHRDHAGEVRHLFHGHDVQSGRRAGADLSRWHRSGESRRNGDGAGAAHQDPADRGGEPRRGFGRRASDAHAHRQSAEHLGNGGFGRHGLERRGGGGRVRAIEGAALRRAWRCERGALATAALSGASSHDCTGACSDRRSRPQNFRFGSGGSRLPRANPALRAGLLPHARIELRSAHRPGHAVPLLRLRRGGERSGGRRLHGRISLLRTDILEDVGDSVSPVIDMGQMEGGFVQGLGWLTLEELVWNANGRLATDGASTYKLPSWTEMPEDFRVNFLTRASEPGVVFGSKAVGEPPLMLAISVREALRDAIAAFGRRRRGGIGQPGDAGTRLLGHPTGEGSSRRRRGEPLAAGALQTE